MSLSDSLKLFHIVLNKGVALLCPLSELLAEVTARSYLVCHFVSVWTVFAVSLLNEIKMM